MRGRARCRIAGRQYAMRLGEPMKAAFPVPTPYGAAGGLTVREYFAAAALQASIPHCLHHGITSDLAAILAVQYADALIKALKERS